MQNAINTLAPKPAPVPATEAPTLTWEKACWISALAVSTEQHADTCTGRRICHTVKQKRTAARK